jgi:hypothetical protein
MTAVFYPDCKALSPNGCFKLEARSPHNGTINHRDGLAATEDEFGFKYREHQSHFRYRLLETSGASHIDGYAGSVLWERWQEETEHSPHELVVSDQGWSIIRPHGYCPELIAVARDGRVVLRVEIVGAEDSSPPREKTESNRGPGNVQRWIAEQLQNTTAGMFWTSHSWRYFFRLQGKDYFVWRTSWGSRLVIDLANAKLLEEEEQRDPDLKLAMQDQETELAYELLAEIAPHVREIQVLLARKRQLEDDEADDDDDDEADDEATDVADDGIGFDAIWAEIAANAASDNGEDNDESDEDEATESEPEPTHPLIEKLSEATAAIQLMGVYRVARSIPLLRCLEEIDCPTYSTGTFALGDNWWLEAQLLRPILHHTLRLLGQEPLGYATYQFTLKSKRHPLPDRATRSYAVVDQVTRELPALQVLDLLGSPDHIKSKSHPDGKFFRWTEDWEYDFLMGQEWLTFRITWDQAERRKRIGTIAALKTMTPTWLHNEERALEILDF